MAETTTTTLLSRAAETTIPTTFDARCVADRRSAEFHHSQRFFRVSSGVLTNDTGMQKVRKDTIRKFWQRKPMLEIARVRLRQRYRRLVCSAIQFAPIDLAVDPSCARETRHGKGLQSMLLRVPSILFPARANTGANQFGVIPRNVMIGRLQKRTGGIPNPFLRE